MDTRSYTLEQLVAALEVGGVDLEDAELIASHLLRFVNDPRGLREALIADAPRIALVLGYTRTH